MSWDWQKRWQSEGPAPLPDDSLFGGLATEASEQEQEPVDTGETDQAEASARGAAGIASIRDAPGVASIERVGGMDWHPVGAADTAGTGRALTKGEVPQLLYGEEHRCAFCRGTGQMCGANLCPVCRGSGKVRLVPPVVRCAFCNGGGHKPVGSTMTCPVCRGRGVVKVKPPVRICPHCRGRGRQMGRSLYCGLCRGSGVATVPEFHELIGQNARSRIEGMVLTRSRVEAPDLADRHDPRSKRPEEPR